MARARAAGTKRKTASESALGPLLRQWRERRRMSQLTLAVEAEISSRHLSFIETGRAKPSREMVLLLARVLDVPPRGRNELLLAAGYAPVYLERGLESPEMTQVRRALFTQGIDLGAQYAMPTDIGRFLFRFNGTYLLKYDFTDPSGLVIHGAGNYDGTGAVNADGNQNFNPRVKFNAGLNYTLAGFSAGFVTHFIGSLTECSPEGGLVAGANTGPGFCYQNSADPATGVPYPRHTVSSQVTFDLMGAYRLVSPAGATTLALGVRNLTNQAPPRLYDSFLTYADPAYDFVGRFFYGRIEHKF